MLFIFPKPARQNFWMKDMKFPIDILWIKGDKIIGVAENAALPITGQELEIYSSPEEADRVLEINAGKAREWGVKVGGRIEL